MCVNRSIKNSIKLRYLKKFNTFKNLLLSMSLQKQDIILPYQNRNLHIKLSIYDALFAQPAFLLCR